MFQYEFERRPTSASSCDSRATTTTDWSRPYVSAKGGPSVERGPRRPLPPRPIVCETKPSKTTVPLKVWIIASASCFSVCAALVLATVVITKWGAEDRYSTRELYANPPEPIYSDVHPKALPRYEEQTTEHIPVIDDIENDIPVLEKLSIFKNIVADREKMKTDLLSKPQMHPVHDTIHHVQRKIEKKDKAKLPDHMNFDFNEDISGNILDSIKVDTNVNDVIETETGNIGDQKVNNDVEAERIALPDFRPIISDNNEDKHLEVKLPEHYLNSLKAEIDYEEYYNDENLYDDYMQSNSMTNYLIEKIQELHDWITKDPDFDMVKNSTKRNTQNDFKLVLKALNESLVEGNVTIIIDTLKDLYFGGNRTGIGGKSILANSTDLVSFGILTLDVILLHNIQTMAWESQETARLKMMRDPDVFAFNALFMDSSKVEEAIDEVLQTKDNKITTPKRRHETADEFDFGKNLLDSIMDVGMSTARAAIHLGRAYKNTQMILNQLSNKETSSIQLPRSIDGASNALNRLEMSYDKDGATNSTQTFYTELDCVWLLYCKNLAATSKLNAPYGTMARINGVALRMLVGELSADKALETIVYEVLTGWSELKCNDMFPRCSKTNAAAVVMGSILQPGRKISTNKG